MPATKVSEALQAQLDNIVPGKSYPRYVSIREPNSQLQSDGKFQSGKEDHIEFHLNSFVVGMYCAIHINGQVAIQTGDQDSRQFTRKLKKDIVRAVTERGAAVEIGSVAPVKTLTSDAAAV